MFLNILKNNNIKYCCGENLIQYDENDRKIGCWSVLGAKNGNEFGYYPLFTHIDNPAYTILYCGKILDNEGVIIGIDIDEYDLSVKEQLLKYGFNEDIINNYKWITKTARGGLHIIIKYEECLDTTTTGLYINGVKSKVDIRGTGGKLILAGSETMYKGKYEWLNGEPNIEDMKTLKELKNDTLYNAIYDKANHKKNNKKSTKIVEDKYKNFVKIEKSYLHNRKLKVYEYTEKTEEDIVMYETMLEKIKEYSVGYTDWCVIGIILANEFKFNNDGLNLFKYFSEFCPKKYNEYQTEKIWDYWKGYDTIDKYPSLNKSILIYYMIDNSNNKNIFNVCRNETKLKLKELKSEDIDDNESVSSANTISSDLFINEQYLALKKTFEKEVYKVKNYYQRIEYDDDNNKKMTKYNATQLRETFMDYAIIYIPNEEGKMKKHYFLKLWMDDPNKLKYYNSCFRPTKEQTFTNIRNGVEYNWLNEFTGFVAEDKPPLYNPLPDKITKYVNIFNKQLLMLNENNPKLAEYCFYFIRKMLLYPEQKSMNVMVCFISSFNGLGKTSFVEFLQQIIGEKYAEITSDCDRIFEKHSQMRHNKILLSYNEGELSSTYSKFNKFKTLITDKSDKYEEKYMMEEDSKNFVHLFFQSNFIVSVKIADGDRRHYVVFGKPCENFKEFQRLWWDMIEDDEAKFIIYDYIKNFDTKGNPMGHKKYDFGNNIPQTEAKTTIQSVFIPVEQQFLRHLCKSNFKEMTYSMGKFDTDFLREFYILTNNEKAYHEDSRTEGGYYKELNFDNPLDRLKKINKLLNKYIKSHHFIELDKPLDKYDTLTTLRNEKMEHIKYQKLIKQSLDLLSIDTSRYEDYWINENGCDEDYSDKFISDGNCGIRLFTKRSDYNKEYVRININCFIAQLNYWRNKGNNNKLTIKDTTIINNFKQIYNLETENELMNIKEIKGNYMIEFKKEDILNRVEEKYSFNNYD